MKNRLNVAMLLSGLGLLNFHLSTIAQPVVTTLPATDITPISATVNGTVNPNGALTASYFQYGLTTNCGNIGTPTLLPAGNATVPVPGFVVRTITGAAGMPWLTT